MERPELTSENAEVMSLAKMLVASPRAAAALRASIERQQAKRPAGSEASPLLCPYCEAPGVPYLKLGDRTFYRRPSDCCQFALRDAAENALHYAMHPNNDPVERVENADLYEHLRERITDVKLLADLDKHELVLRDVANRITGLVRAQGGVDPWVPSFQRPEPIPFTPKKTE